MPIATTAMPSAPRVQTSAMRSKGTIMNKHRSRPAQFRNSVDMNDKVQVKVLRKRLKLSEAQFTDAVEKSGSSIAALVKEATNLKLAN